MSNDLLFSILPRNRTVPVQSSSGVTRVRKDAKSEKIDDEQKDGREETKRADEETVQKRHGKIVESKTEPDSDSKDDDQGHLDTYV